MEIETQTKTIEKKYTTINGVEVSTARLLEFLEHIEDADPFNPVSWEPKYDAIADVLVEEDIVGRTVRGSFYAEDDKAIVEMQARLRREYRVVDEN